MHTCGVQCFICAQKELLAPSQTIIPPQKSFISHGNLLIDFELSFSICISFQWENVSQKSLWRCWLAFDLRQATTTARRRRNSFKGFNDLFLLQSSGRQRQWNETSINHLKALSSKARSVKMKSHFSPSSTGPAAKPKPFAICFCANLIYERFFFFSRLSSNCDELFRWEVKWFWHVAPLWRTTLWKN